jgi:hypothetical protein
MGVFELLSLPHKAWVDLNPASLPRLLSSSSTIEIKYTYVKLPVASRIWCILTCGGSFPPLESILPLSPAPFTSFFQAHLWCILGAFFHPSSRGGIYLLSALLPSNHLLTRISCCMIVSLSPLPPEFLVDRTWCCSTLFNLWPAQNLAHMKFPSTLNWSESTW